MENLFELVDRMVTSFLPAAVRNKNIFVNEIPGDLPLEQPNEWVASIITGLIGIAAVNTTGNFIRFSARKQEQVMILHMQEFNKMPVNGELRQLQILAEKIGGNLSVTVQNPDKRITSLTFPR